MKPARREGVKRLTGCHPEPIRFAQGKLREGSPQLLLLQLLAKNCRDASLRSVGSHVIPAQAGIQLGEVDPRLGGGDEDSTFTSMDGPEAHDRSA